MHIGPELAFKINQLSLFYFKLFNCPSDVKRPPGFHNELVVELEAP